MAEDITIPWRQERPTIYAAYLTGLDGPDLYAGYVARSPDGVWWRGYLGIGFTPVGRGPRPVVQAAIEQMVREALEQTMEAVEAVEAVEAMDRVDGMEVSERAP